MSSSRKVAVAVAISMLLHVILFTVLALTPERAAIATEEAQPEKPLEIVLQAAAPQPERKPETVEPAVQEAKIAKAEEIPAIEMEKAGAEPVELGGEVVRTELDPAHLKKTDHAPEGAEFLAAHDSVAVAGSKKKHSSRTEKSTAPVALPRPTPISALPSAPPLRMTLPRPTPISAEPAQASPEAGGEPETDDAEGDEEGSVAAIGAWKKAVGNSIGTRWNSYRKSKLALLAVGSVRIKFTIDAKGAVSDVQIVSNTATPANALYAVRAISDAEIPPIPPERLARLPGGRVEVTYTFTIFPNS